MNDKLNGKKKKLLQYSKIQFSNFNFCHVNPCAQPEKPPNARLPAEQPSPPFLPPGPPHFSTAHLPFVPFQPSIICQLPIKKRTELFNRQTYVHPPPSACSTGQINIPVYIISLTEV